MCFCCLLDHRDMASAGRNAFGVTSGQHMYMHEWVRLHDAGCALLAHAAQPPAYDGVGCTAVGLLPHVQERLMCVLTTSTHCSCPQCCALFLAEHTQHTVLASNAALQREGLVNSSTLWRFYSTAGKIVGGSQSASRARTPRL